MPSSRTLSRFRKLAVVAAVTAPMGAAMATNGMLMEGYGPISAAMGGAAQGHDHGTAAMAENPATLALGSATTRLDVALGSLGPKVTSSMPGMDAPSSGTSYLMPALGYTTRSGNLTYGVGMFAQGGMGTEYDATSFLTAGSGSAVRSELGVGSVIFPLAYQVSPDLTLGATLDYMWASMDLLMAASPVQLSSMITDSSGVLGGAITSGALNTATWARINFSDDSKFSGAAKAKGLGSKIGATLKVGNGLTVGGSYRFKSKLDDMKTEATSASMTANPGGGAQTFTDSGSITIIDFQMPSVLALGASWQVQPALLVAVDIKSIGWADAMKALNMRFDSAGYTGSVSFSMPQNWRDQTVLNLGVAWKASEQLTLRAGLNLADNPIPEALVNPLFPATVKNHVTMGLGYKVSDTGAFNAALTMAPTSTLTNQSGVTVSHEQTNLQLMYTQRF